MWTAKGRPDKRIFSEKWILRECEAREREENNA